MKTIEIQVEVTQEHIDKGVRVDICKCPVALALKKIGFEELIVGVRTVSYISESSLCTGLPEEARVFIRYFDRGLPVEPFTFPLTVTVKDDFQPVSNSNSVTNPLAQSIQPVAASN